MTTILRSNEGSTRVAVTRAFPGGGRTDHVVRDVMAAISVLTSALRCHGQVDLLQGGGLVAFVDESAPTSHGGNNSCVSGCRVRWQTGGGDLVGEGDWLGQAEDGVVVVNSLAVPVRMFDDLSNINPVVHAVRDAVLSEKNADSGGGKVVGAVGGGEHVG